MKKIKIKLTIIIVCFCLSAMAQKKIIIDRDLTITLPEATVKYIDTALMHLLSDNLNGKITEEFPVIKNRYRLNGMNFFFLSLKNITDPNYLEKEKKYMQHQEGSGYKRERQFTFETIGTNHFLIERYKNKNNNSIIFYCLNSKKNRGLRGSITYNASEHAEAEKIIDDLLRSITFTD